MLLSFYTSLFAQDETTEVKVMLQKFGLVTQNAQEFAEVIIQIKRQISVLDACSFDEINDALVEFNQKFDHTALASPFDEHDEGASHLKSNIVRAFSDVREEMNKNRVDLQLTYHNSGHSAEMFFDTFQACSVAKTSLPIHLFMPLCALYHDVIFRNSRIKDEKNSAAALKTFLQPVLEKLSPHNQDIIGKLIDVLIVGGTTPLLLNSVPSNKKNQPMQKTVFEMVELFNERKMAKRNWSCTSGSAVSPQVLPMKILLQDMLKTMAILDVQRTSISILHQPNNNFYSNQSASTGDWNIIEKALKSEFTLSQKKKIGQNFRVMAEFILLNEKDKNSIIYQWANVLYLIQSGNPPRNWEIPTALIPLIAKRIKGEISFASRMNNTVCSYESMTTSYFNYPFENTWNEHIKILEKLHQYLTDESINVGNKIPFIKALTRVSIEQDGKNISMTQILAACDQLENINHSWQTYISLSESSDNTVPLYV